MNLRRFSNKVAIRINNVDFQGSYGSRVSKNLAAAKGFAALIVMAGHIGTGIPNYWVIVTVGLLIFSISSGYFTWQRYSSEFSLKIFYKRKLIRLLPQLLTIEMFLFVLFYFQNRQGLYSFHTLINLIGLNGFLNWFRIQNKSPYGAGMWFLTLLLIFYFLYPFLERLYRKIGTLLVTVLGILLLYILHQTVIYGHALWLTASGFLLGIFFSSRPIHIPPIISLFLASVIAIIMVISHSIFMFDDANFFFILAIAAMSILFLFEAEIPKLFLFIGCWLSGILLEIYLLHPYFDVKLSGIHRLDQSISAALVIIASWFIAKTSKILIKYI